MGDSSIKMPMSEEKKIVKNNWISLIDSMGDPWHQWAMSYIKRELPSLISPNDITTRSIREVIWMIQDDPAKELFLRRMGNAFAQKKLRDKKNGKKNYNFIMSKQVQTRLRILANAVQRPMNETLELIIHEEYQKLRASKENERARKRDGRRGHPSHFPDNNFS